MANAGAALADEARKRFQPKRVLIVCGPGNNGGDGFVMATRLAEECEVRVVLSGPANALKTPEARWSYDRLSAARVGLEVFRSDARFLEMARDVDLIVDALLGSGIQGAPRDPIRTLVRLIHRARRPVLSVDVPTGHGTKTAVRPTVTLCLAVRKKGLTRANAGTIIVREIGIPRAAFEEVGPGDLTVPYPRNRPRSHKGQNGRLLIVAGGPYTGAPVLASTAAARTGIDIVRLYAPQVVGPFARKALPDLIVHQGRHRQRLVPEDADEIVALFAKVDALLVGPGIGAHPETVAMVESLLQAAAKRGLRTILDADAIVVAGKNHRLARRLRPLVTPHHGEFREYTGTNVPAGEAAAKRRVRAEARRLRSTLLTKGPIDIISDGTRLKVNRFHDPAMTTAGTGDVLAGLAAGFVAKGMDSYNAACAAAFLNGATGRFVARRQGGTLVASDIVKALPTMFAEFVA